MPLIDLKSNLTNLRFGNDRPGYGSSGLPYIQTKIPGVINPTGNENPIFRPLSTGNLDYPVRGGEINFSIGTQTFTLSSKIDRTRIKKFFEDAPRGKAFIDKQIGLQLTNPKIETGNTLFGFGQSVPVPGILENTRIYNKGQNTLAQVAASGTGAHAIRHGLLPFNPIQKNYYAIVNQQNIDGNNDGTDKNRLVILSKLKMTNSTDPIVNRANVKNIDKINTLGISLNKNFLFQYLGGPESVYGVGSTNIKRVVDTTKLRSINVMTYDQLAAQNNKGLTKIQDFYSQITSGSSASNNSLQKKYEEELNKLEERLKKNPNNKTIERRIDFLKQNKPGSLTPSNLDIIKWDTSQTIDSRFFVPAGKYQDKMNKANAFYFENSSAPWTNPDTDYDDLIKFLFEIIDNDNPTQSIALFFRAFLTAGITDNNSATYNPTKYVGRGETFYTYQGFERDINFSFIIAAHSKEELMPLYQKLNLLMGQVYPDYSKIGIMRAPLVRITIGNYLYRVPGFIQSVNITIDNDASWELEFGNDGLDSDIAQLPKKLNVSIAFKPIMDTLQNRYGTIIVGRPQDSSGKSDDVAANIKFITPIKSTV